MTETEQASRKWDTASSEEFFKYYAERSVTPRDIDRFTAARNYVLRVMQEHGAVTTRLKVVDIGCGAGTQSFLWSALGHDLHGIDVNEPLVRLARERAAEKGYKADMRVGSATELPWKSGTMDLCILPELLEHVPDWQRCLDEAARVVKCGGFVYLTTTNKLCPFQQEFNLPAYSWYPRPLKRHFEKLAVTSRPELVQHATYPAVNWFTPYQLKREIKKRGFRKVYDRFDSIDTNSKSLAVRMTAQVIKNVSILRFFGHVVTTYSAVIAQK